MLRWTQVSWTFSVLHLPGSSSTPGARIPHDRLLATDSRRRHSLRSCRVGSLRFTMLAMGPMAAPRVHLTLKAEGIGVGRKRVAGFMRRMELKGRFGRIDRSRTTGECQSILQRNPQPQPGEGSDRARPGLDGRHYLFESRGAVALSGRGDGQVFAAHPELESECSQGGALNRAVAGVDRPLG